MITILIIEVLANLDKIHRSNQTLGRNAPEK